MHILQLVPTLDVGGVERGVLDLTKGLVRLDHRVTVVSAVSVTIGETPVAVK